MNQPGNTQETLQHLERLTRDQSPFYPLETPFFSGLAAEGKINPDEPIGLRHMIGERLSIVCDKVIIVDFLNDEGQRACIGTPNDGIKGFLSLCVMHDAPQIGDNPKKTSHLGVTFVVGAESTPRVFPQHSEGLMHPTLAWLGGQELMRWGIQPHFTETPISFAVRPDVVDRINAQLATF